MVDRVPGMVDMRKTPAEKEDSIPTAANGPDYPYGLCISLCQDELDKLDLPEDIDVDDLVHLHAMAVVTSISSNKVTGGEPNCRIELQITHISAEDEKEEDEEAEDSHLKKLYM